MPRTEKQLEQIRKEKKKLIMDVSLELFATNGFHATTITETATLDQLRTPQQFFFPHQ